MVTIYNRYIPQETSYTWVGPEQEQQKKQPSAVSAGGSTRKLGGWRALLAEHSEREGAGASYIRSLGAGIRSLWEANSLDSGDLLLILILLMLLKEGEDPELVIVLGLMILFGLGLPVETDAETKTGDG